MRPGAARPCPGFRSTIKTWQLYLARYGRRKVMFVAALRKRPRINNVLIILALAAGLAQLSTPASAVPSFSVQTDQPCSACHVNSFGPRLKQMGRDFKLYGYVA